MKLAVLVSLALLTGCARFGTTQIDRFTNYDPDGKRTSTQEKITTAASYTFFDGRASLATWKATQTDKTQGASVGGLAQESNGTNAVETLREMNSLLRTLNGMP